MLAAATLTVLKGTSVPFLVSKREVQVKGWNSSLLSIILAKCLSPSLCCCELEQRQMHKHSTDTALSINLMAATRTSAFPPIFSHW